MTTTTTTTTTMRRELLEAFPVPPTHIPLNPPPTGPPSLPLPPVPGPSRVSVDEQLLFLSSRRSSRYSHRDSAISISTTTDPSCIFLDSSWRRSKHHHHHHNESITSIDSEDPSDDPHVHFLPDSPSSPTDIKDLHLERRAERSKSASLKQDLAVRSRARSRPPPIPESIPTEDQDPSIYKQNHSSPRTPSPDISLILSNTPRPILKKSASQSRLLPKQPILPSTIATDCKRRASEGVIRAMRSTSSWHRLDPQSISPEQDESEDDKKPDADDSDSSIDLHTPLPNLMVRDGLLSPNSRLLPPFTSTRRHDGRSDSIITINSKSGMLKDTRDTPMRRVRHRDNSLLKGGIGLTTGLGWSDSEDEDAPSPLTRRLSTLNLSRRSSASSVRTTSSLISHNHSLRTHPLSRSYSSGTLLETEYEHLESLDGEPATTTPVSPLPPSLPPAVRPRLPSASRISRPSIPPTSWSTTNNNNRISTSSVGSTFSVDTTLSDGVPRRVPSGSNSKLGRLRNTSLTCGPALRDSSGSSENHKSSSADRDRSSSSTTTTSGSTGMSFPRTPRETYDPSMSTPAGFGTDAKPYNVEKSLPPLPLSNRVLKKRPSNLAFRLENPNNNDNTIKTFNFPRPRPRTLSSNTASPLPSPTFSSAPPSASLGSPVVRPLHLPRRAARVSSGSVANYKNNNGAMGDRAAVPVPVPSTPQSTLRRPSIPLFPGPSSPPSSPPPSSPSSGGTRPRPRTGTGMVYRTTSGSRIRAPMTLSTSSSVSSSGVGRPMPNLNLGHHSSPIPPV